MATATAHLLATDGMSADFIYEVLNAAEAFDGAGERKTTLLRGRLVVLAFFENSTRTRSSFEIACKRLSADTLSVSGSGSSVQKGETLLDTVENLKAMGPDAIVIRHASSGAAAFIASRTGLPTINAGDGRHEHPTQALLDLYTIRKHKGRGPHRELAGLKAAIIGDIRHGRVAHSNIHAMRAVGMRVHVAGPATLMPRHIEQLGVTVHRDVESAVEGADVVMALRIQRERLAEGPTLFPGNTEYARLFGLTGRRMALAAPGAILMHPGPINRGVELPSELADGPGSVILDQVAAGVVVRMAVLTRVLAPEATGRAA